MNAQDKADMTAIGELTEYEYFDRPAEDRIRARLTHLDRLERETIPALEGEARAASRLANQCRDLELEIASYQAARDKLERETIPALTEQLKDTLEVLAASHLALAEERAFRDKLARALAWGSEHARRTERAWHHDLPSGRTTIEPHDGTPHGRAEALVRLWKRVTGGQP